MPCWLCESANVSKISNETTPRKMLLTLFPDMQSKLPGVLDFCRSCLNELSLYYKFRISYAIDLKRDSQEPVKTEDSLVDLTDDCDDPKGTCLVCCKRIFGIVIFIEEGDDMASDVVAAKLVRKFFPKLNLEQYESPQACDRCSEMMKGMFEYEQKCKVKTVINSVIQVDVKLTKTESLIAQSEHFMASLDEDNMSIDNWSSSQEMPSCSSRSSHIYDDNNFPFKIESIVSRQDEQDDEDSSSVKGGTAKGNAKDDIVLSLSEDSNEVPFLFDQEIGDHFLAESRSFEDEQNFMSMTEDEESRITLSSFVEDFKPFEMDSNMFTHVQTTKGKEYQCKTCTYTSNRKDNMRRHVFIRHIKKRITLSCNFCSFRTTSESILQRHIDDRHVNSVRKFPCTMCPYYGNHYSQLQAHMKLVHKPDKNHPNQVFKCSMCDFITSRAQYLQKHNRYKHADIMVFLDCAYCNYKTRRRDNLKQHMLHMHMKVEEIEDYHKCQLCGFQSKRKDKIKRHMECVHGEEEKDKPCYKCGVCSYECTRKDTLKRHVEYQHLKKDIVFKCNLCKYQTDIFDYLQKHIKYAHTQPDKLYQCHLCPYTTFKKILFGQHYRRRHGCAPPLELEGRCECFYKAGGYNSSCRKCRKNYEETDESNVICLDDESDSNSGEMVGHPMES